MYNILICDDEQDIVNALKIYLSGGDYCLFEASNGREALEVVEKNDIHLILMDIMMPDMDGYEATRAIRLSEKVDAADIPIIALTANAFAEDAKAAHDAGKPWVLDPVGLGIGSLRTQLVNELKQYKPAIVRGNASEIIALAGLWGLEGEAADLSRVRGVDTTDTVDAARDAAVALARYTGGAVVVSGEVDLITDGTTVAKSHGGSPLMSKITGCGCSQGGVLAVYACADDPFTAAICGTAVYNVAGTRAAAVADAPASFKVAFIDELYRATAQDIADNRLELEEA